MLDGDFKLEDDILTFLRGSDVTRAILEELNRVVQESIDRGDPPAETLKAAAAVVPGLKPFLNKAASKAAELVLAAILSAIIQDSVKPATEVISKPVAAQVQRAVPAATPPALVAKPEAPTSTPVQNPSERVGPLTVKPRQQTQKFKQRKRRK